MAKQLLRDVSETTRRIMDGELDDELDAIVQAVRARVRDRFRVGRRVRVVRDDQPDLHGQVGVIMKVNPTRVVVGFGEKVDWRGGYVQELGIPHDWLELV